MLRSDTSRSPGSFRGRGRRSLMESHCTSSPETRQEAAGLCGLPCQALGKGAF